MTPDMKKFKSVLYEQLSRIGKALASPRRLELLDLLSQGERTVELLAGEAGLTIANTSQHLKILKSARLVESEKNGIFITYRLADDRVASLVESLRSLAENRLAEIDKALELYLRDHGQLEPVDRRRLRDKICSGNATVVDVRPAEEFSAGHIPKALSIPLKDLEKHISALPKDQLIVAYCRGRFCMLAVHAVEMLKKHGFDAVRLDDTINEWRAHGLPVETGKELELSKQKPENN